MSSGDRKRKKSLFRSVLCVMLLLSAVPMILTGLLMLYSAARGEAGAGIRDIQGQALILSNQLRNGGYLESAGQTGTDRLLDQVADLWGGRIQVINSAGRIVKDTYRTDTGKYNISENVLQGFSGSASGEFDRSSRQFVVVQPVLKKEEAAETAADRELQAPASVQGVILVTVDAEPRILPLQDTQKLMYLGWAVCLMLTGAVSISYLHRRSRLFRSFGSAFEKAAEGNLSARITGTRYRETEMVGDAFNRTVERLQNLDETRQEFVSNAAHELKTPMTSVKVLADSLLSMGEDVPVEMYREFMEDISREINRESNIIEDLLSVSRLDAGSDLNISPTDLNAWIETTLRRLRPIARQRNIELLMESYRPVTADVDAAKLTLAVSNMVENAIKYNRDEGWVKVSLNADYQYFYIKISDSGCGIPADALPHIFERFYRVNKDRSRATGGTGLGLPIAKTIVNLHNGDLRVYSKPGEGTTIVMRVPLFHTEGRDRA